MDTNSVIAETLGYFLDLSRTQFGIQSVISRRAIKTMMGVLHSQVITSFKLPLATRELRAQRSLRVYASNSPDQLPPSKFIKVCGVTNPEDAEIAVSTGANLIGMILWPKAKRSIPTSIAREISAVAQRNGASAVGVFVDEDAATIARVCEESDVHIAQLHGDGARAALLDLPPHLKVVYVMHADKSGTVETQSPEQLASASGVKLERNVDWVLLDSLKGGSGESFDWKSLNPPVGSSGWLLAGGLTPDNVVEAIETAHPSGVDVSSGVCGPDGLKKDPEKVINYVVNARRAFNQ